MALFVNMKPMELVEQLFFKPDMICTFDKGIYLCVPQTDAGLMFTKRVRGVKMKTGMIYASSQFERIYDLMLKLGMCVQRIDGD